MGGLLRSLLFVPGSDDAEARQGRTLRRGRDRHRSGGRRRRRGEGRRPRHDTRGDRASWRARPRSSSASTASRPGCSTTTSRRSSARGVDLDHGPEGRVRPTRSRMLDDRIARGRAGRRHRAGHDPRPRAHRDARGLADCEAILAGAPERVHTAVFGAGDFSVQLGIDLTPEATEIALRALAPGRRRRAPRAWRAPIDGPWLRLEDDDGPGGRQPALPRARLPGPRDRLPAAGRDGAARVLRALRRGGRPRSAASSRRSRRPSRAASPRCASTAASSTTPSTAWRSDRIERYDAWRAPGGSRDP